MRWSKVKLGPSSLVSGYSRSEFLNRVRRFDSSRGHHLNPHVNGPILSFSSRARVEWPRIGPATDTE
jgi:hypothetical protein